MITTKNRSFCLTSLLLTIFLLFGFSAFAGVTISTSGPGGTSGDSVYANQNINFNIVFQNDQPVDIKGFTNGFKLYSPESATWAIPVGTPDLDLINLFDFGTYVNGYSLDGVGTDTLGFGGLAIYGNGMTVGYNDIIGSISTSFENSQIGKTICIDTCFFPPSGYWVWSDQSGLTNYTPSWGGPYCYTIVESIEPTDSLFFSSVEAGALCDNENANLTVSIKATNPIKRVIIPIEIPEDMTNDNFISISTFGKITFGWSFNPIFNQGTNSLIIELYNTSSATIPAGENEILDIRFHGDPKCNTDWIFSWDTTLYNDPTSYLHFIDENDNVVRPGFDPSLNSTSIDGYIPGDANGDEDVGISDLTAIVDYLFFQDVICYENPVDINQDCELGISDLTYIVDFLFVQGPAPRCGCASSK